MWLWEIVSRTTNRHLDESLAHGAREARDQIGGDVTRVRSHHSLPDGTKHTDEGGDDVHGSPAELEGKGYDKETAHRQASKHRGVPIVQESIRQPQILIVVLPDHGSNIQAVLLPSQFSFSAIQAAEWRISDMANIIMA